MSRQVAPVELQQPPRGLRINRAWGQLGSVEVGCSLVLTQLSSERGRLRVKDGEPLSSVAPPWGQALTCLGSCIGRKEAWRSLREVRARARSNSGSWGPEHPPEREAGWKLLAESQDPGAGKIITRRRERTKRGGRPEKRASRGRQAWAEGSPPRREQLWTLGTCTKCGCRLAQGRIPGRARPV